MPHWHYAILQLHPDDLLIHPVIGEVEQTRAQAHAIILGMLETHPAPAPVAARWRAGPRDDTVSYDLMTWHIYPCAAGTCDESTRKMIESFAAEYRDAGLHVQVAHRGQ